MKPSLRFSIGRSPFRATVVLPIEDVIGAVVSLFNPPTIAQEEPKIDTVTKYLHILVHESGEIDIPSSTQQEALDAMNKTLKLMELKNPKLYRVEGTVRVPVSN